MKILEIITKIICYIFIAIACVIISPLLLLGCALDINSTEKNALQRSYDRDC